MSQKSQNGQIPTGDGGGPDPRGGGRGRGKPLPRVVGEWADSREDSLSHLAQRAGGITTTTTPATTTLPPYHLTTTTTAPHTTTTATTSTTASTTTTTFSTVWALLGPHRRSVLCGPFWARTLRSAFGHPLPEHHLNLLCSSYHRGVFAASFGFN